MVVTAQMVKELRERTGAAMMQCKKALVECEGNIETAVEHLRKTGIAKADKKSDRIAAEGIVVALASDDKKTAIILEINCETDFVERDENFIAFANAVASVALNNKIGSIEALASTDYEGGKSVEDARKALIAKIGENVRIRRIELITSTGNIGVYLHGSRIGVVVNMTNGTDELAKDIAMHVAATSPLVVRPDDVPAEVINKEREIFTAQAKESGKPEEIIAKMIDGRMKKFLDEVSLLGQDFVKDPSTTVAQLLKAQDAEVDAFTRYIVGEGIEKKEDNFVEEVMAQVRDNQ